MIKQSQEERYKRGLMLCQRIQTMIKQQESPVVVQRAMRKAYKVMADMAEIMPAAKPITALLAVDLVRLDEAMERINEALTLPFEPYVKTALENARKRIIELQTMGGNA